MGGEDYVKELGHFSTIDLLGVLVIIVRCRDGEVRAFINSCRHRGSNLLDGNDHHDLIVCPYHSWSYDPQRAAGLRGMADFRSEEVDLTPVRQNYWLRSIFICFDPAAAPLADHPGNTYDSCPFLWPCGSMLIALPR